jgi:hypothetical protein
MHEKIPLGRLGKNARGRGRVFRGRPPAQGRRIAMNRLIRKDSV